MTLMTLRLNFKRTLQQLFHNGLTFILIYMSQEPVKGGGGYQQDNMNEKHSRFLYPNTEYNEHK